MNEELQAKNYSVEEKRGFNITSLILGIIAILLLCFPFFPILPAVLSIIFGLLGLNKGGKGMGIAGLICSVLAIFIEIIMIIYIISAANTATKEVNKALQQIENNSSYSTSIFDDNFGQSVIDKAQNQVDKWNYEEKNNEIFMNQLEKTEDAFNKFFENATSNTQKYNNSSTTSYSDEYAENMFDKYLYNATSRN